MIEDSGVLNRRASSSQKCEAVLRRHLRLIDFLYYSNLGWRVIKKMLRGLGRGGTPMFAPIMTCIACACVTGGGGGVKTHYDCVTIGLRIHL